MAMGIERQAEGYLVVDEINLRESYLRDILSLRAHFDGLCEEFGVGVVAAARRADGNGCGHRQATRNNQLSQRTIAYTTIKTNKHTTINPQMMFYTLPEEGKLFVCLISYFGSM